MAVIILQYQMALIFTETHAFAQRNYGGGGRIRQTPGMRGRGGQGHERKTNYGRVRSGTRGSKGSVELNGRKSVNDRLSRNTKLSGRLQTLLPGQDLEIASSGFKNLGQFVAAVHVSKNLGIPFDELKYQMTDPDSPKSLGKAIRQLRPDASSRREARKAKKQAKKDLKETSE